MKDIYVCFSKKIKKIPFLSSFLDGEVYLFSERPKYREIKAIIGWGFKKTSQKAREFAEKNGIPYIALEDGFICSYGLRIDGYPPLSLIADPVGMYYNAYESSYLENLLNSDSPFTACSLDQAKKAQDLIINHNLTKYNYAPEINPSSLKGKREKRVLLVDQTWNDASVVYGKADKNSFKEMLESALDENPDSDIYIKIHPDVIKGKKKGYMSKYLDKIKDDRIHFIFEDVNSISLLKNFDKIYVVSSQMGFEALLLGKEVHCFGVPFYAGWGLTVDKIPCHRRKKKRNILELIAAAYLIYCRYINPVNGKKGDFWDVANFILFQKKQNLEIGKYNYYCIDFHIVKRKHVLPFLKTPFNEVHFIKSSELKNFVLPLNSVFIVWGAKKKREIFEKHKTNPVWTVEDGFIRSAGFGAEFVPPMSIVMDKKGIYYNPNEENELELILNTHNFTEKEVEQAERLRQLIIKNNITKYNFKPVPLSKKIPLDKKIILVPGQVEEDEAVVLGGDNIKDNLSLLKTVRELNPDSYIIYKPHPDILSRNRKKEKYWQEIKKYSDHIEDEADIISCINVADEVHVISSLSGFDALIRQKAVFTYGIPFYAGWGLTKDYQTIPRRARTLTLQQLVAGVLIKYPLYYDWKLKAFADCETIIYRIIEEKKEKKFKTVLPYPLKKILNWLKAGLWLTKKELMKF